ncbi:MAG: hyperosmotically inducible periplasmic protein [Blastocatellia bacterium]|nr:hyperosmotically inducible periplasmic protein [Blastocatellia bacterium]
MRMKLLLPTAIMALALALTACNDTATTTNERANTNANTGLVVPATPAPTATPKYTEQQARDERARAKENKETVGQSLDDAWIHTKIVAKLIGNSQTPERTINVDVVNGEVTLRGTVDTNEAKAEAERVAKETDGVKKVTSQLKVSSASAKPANTKKSTNTGKSKTNP